MTLLFISWGRFDGLEAALRCAAVHADCPIMIVNDQPDAGIVGLRSEVAHLNIAELKSGQRMLDALAHQCPIVAASTARWFVLREMMERGIVSGDLFVADWDTLVYSPLAEACAPFADFDYCVCGDGRMSSGPCFFSGRIAREVLNDFCDKVKSLSPVKRNLVTDLTAWARIKHPRRVGNLCAEHNGAVFDFHLDNNDNGKYLRDGRSKAIKWRDGKPYFLTQTGEVRAHTLHCHGSQRHNIAGLFAASQKS